MCSITAPQFGLKSSSTCTSPARGCKSECTSSTLQKGILWGLQNLNWKCLSFFYMKNCNGWKGKAHLINRNSKCHQCNYFLRKIFTLQLNQAALQPKPSKTATMEKILCLLFNDYILITAKFHPFPMLAGRIIVKCRVLQISKQVNNKIPPKDNASQNTLHSFIWRSAV